MRAAFLSVQSQPNAAAENQLASRRRLFPCKITDHLTMDIQTAILCSGLCRAISTASVI